MISSLFNLLGAGILGFGNSSVQGAFNAKEASKMRRFQAQEAEKQRNWMETMSNTAHQREVDDLYAAGLNPILSANGGSGASVGTPSSPSGAMGHMDAPQSAAMLSALTSMIKSSSEIDLLAAQADKTEAETGFLNQQSESSAFNRLLADKRFKFELARDTRNFAFEEAKFTNQKLQFEKDLQHKTDALRSNLAVSLNRMEDNMSIQSARLRQEAKLARERMSNELTKAWIHAGSNLLNGVGKLFMKGK